MQYFITGSTASTTAELAGIHSNSTIRLFHKLREKITLKQQDRIAQFCRKIELDESYFGGLHKIKRGRGATDKVTVWPPSD